MGLIDREAYAETQETTIKTSSSATMRPGTYLCRIQKVVTDWETTRGEKRGVDATQCVMLVLDVDDGEFAGRYSSEFYDDPSKDKKHAIYLSFKPLAYGFLKRNCRCIDEANHGFSSLDAVDSGHWMEFIGRRVWVLFDGREYTYEGRDGVSVRPSFLVFEDDELEPTVELLDGNKVKWSEYTAAQKASTAAAAPSAYANDDIPF